MDSTFYHAKRMEKALSNPAPSDVVEIMANRLKSIAGSNRPLEVIRLRGGIASSRLSSPSQPAILLTTLPMYGSRLLFRGYGSSRGMRPIDAAMAGTDSLILLDEAHLAPHLRTLCEAITDCTPHIHPILNEARSRPTLVQLTATGNQANEDRFTLNDEDRQHPIVGERLSAVKQLKLIVNEKKNENFLAKATHDVLKNASSPTTCLVFTNTPKVARTTFSCLRKLMQDAEILLLTGRIREQEAGQIRQHVLNGMSTSSDTNRERTRHFIVVATQTLEVGADIDAEYLITEQCGVRALTQRLGRLNRLGHFKNAIAVYVHTPATAHRSKGSKPDFWPVYGEEPKKLLDTLRDYLKNNTTENVSLSPEYVAEILGPPDDNLGRAPELLPGILWEWVKTSSPHKDEAPVEPYFSGISGAQMLVTIIWRAHVPKEDERLWPHATDREAIGVPIGEFRNTWQKAWNQRKIFRLRSDGTTIEKTSINSVRPGDQIVLHSDCGLMDEFGWNPDATTAKIMDISLIDHGLPLDTEAIRRICDISVKQDLMDKALGKASDDIDVERHEQINAIEDILNQISQSSPHGWDSRKWDEFINSLREKPVVTPYREVPRLRITRQNSKIQSDDFDETSLAKTSVKLKPHCDAVADLAKSVCERLGLPSDLINVVEHAGRLHDIGKADQRFQRWLDPDCDHSLLLAKSNTPHHEWGKRQNASGWPKWGRHEALSARLVHTWLDKNPDWCDSIKRDLLVHLVISHHGKARPLIAPVVDNTSLTVEGLISDEPVVATADLEIIDWEQPSRFRNLNDHFGPWGIALLEAILRLSDQAVSSGMSISPNTNR